MLEKLQSMQGQAEETKAKLSQLTVEGEAGGNLIVVEMDGNRKLKKLTINTELSNMEKEDLEDLLTVAIDRALTAVEKLNEQEMAASAKDLLGGFGM
jgi:DNA-binding YbaB/EbfC family protein